MPTRNVKPTDHLDTFIKASNASEDVRDGLQLLERREREDEAKLAWLRAEAKIGFDQLDRGDGIEFESMDDLADYIDRLSEEVSAEIADEPKCG